jgi:hypothetical protein
MLAQTHDKETLDDLRNLDIFREASDQYSAMSTLDRNTNAEAQAICRAILIAADVLRRTIIATHDAQFEATHYNP